VISVDNWKGKPPKDWWKTEAQEFSHNSLGGVTNGTFTIRLAKSLVLEANISADVDAVVPAKLKSVLDPTVKGSRCPIPKDKVAPLGQDGNGLLHWERRFYNVESPTVYSQRKHWVRRRLSPKELCSVLDLSRAALMTDMSGHMLHDIMLPGKVRAQVVENIRRGFCHLSAKRGAPTGSCADERISKGVRWIFDLEKEVIRSGDLSKPASLRPDTVTIKSAKADDASVPSHLWNDKCLDFTCFSTIPREIFVTTLDIIREKFLIRYWKRKVARDFWRWVRGCDKSSWFSDFEERRHTIQAGCKAIIYAVEASWWEWEGGSFPFFWRWEKEFIREMRDGIPPRFTTPPRFVRTGNGLTRTLFLPSRSEPRY
jgi:hypothetical protein